MVSYGRVVDMPPRGYRSITIREETYLALKEEAARRGLSVSKLLEEIAKRLHEGRGEAEAGGGPEVEERLRRLEEEVARLRKAVYDVVVTIDLMKRSASRERPEEG